MRKILCALSLFSCLHSDAILTVDGYKQYISNFRSDIDLLKGYILTDFEDILKEQRLYGNFKSGIRGRHDGKGLSYQDQGNDAMTRLVIQLFPSVGGQLNAEGTGSFTSLIAKANDKDFSEIDLIVGMFQLAQDVRSQMKETDSGTDTDGEKNLRDLITTDKNQFSKFSAEECLRYIDLLRNDPKIEQNKKDQIEKRIWKSVQNQLKDISTNWSLKCLKMPPGCKDEDIKANIQNKIMKKSVSHYFGSIQDKNLFSALSKLIINVFGSINSENINFKGKIDPEKYPQNYTNYVISAYAWRMLNNNQLKTLSEKLQQRLGYKGGSYANHLIKFLLENQGYFPLKKEMNLLQGTAVFKGAEFQDCIETTMKQFFAILLYDINNHPVDDRLPNTEIGKKIKKFFEGGRKKIQEQVLSNTNRSEWADIVENIPGILYSKYIYKDDKYSLQYIPKYGNDVCKGDENIIFYELDANLENFLRAVSVLLKGYNAGIDDGTKIYKRKYKAQETVKFLNRMISKESITKCADYISEHAEEILNDILGIRTDVELTATVNSEEGLVEISANLFEEDQESVFLKILENHAYFIIEQKERTLFDITENEWIDSLLVNRHKATKNYHPVSKFTAARHKTLKRKIFPEALARRFYSNQYQTEDLIKVLEDYSKQEQIEVIKSIYNHAKIMRFLDLFYKPKGIIKEMFDKISTRGLEGKTPEEVLLRYYISSCRDSINTGDSINTFDDILNKSIKTKNILKVKNFFKMVSQIYANMDLIIEREEDKKRPTPQPKGSETLLDYMLFVVENISNDDLKIIRNQLVETLDLFDIDHLIGSQKLENLVKKLQKKWEPGEKTYCLNERLKRSAEKIRLMSHIARLTYDGVYFLNIGEQSFTVDQAKNLFLFNGYDDVLDHVENPKELVDNLPIILTNALAIYDMNESTTTHGIDYHYPLQVMKNIGNKYLPHISVEKAKQWIDIHPILIHLFNEKNTNISQIFDYFLEQIKNGKISIDHISWFSPFMKFIRESISDEQINRLFDVLSPDIPKLIKRSDFKSFCEDIFDTCINTGKKGVQMLKFLSTYCGEVGRNAIEDKFSEIMDQQRNGKGKNYKDEEMSEYLKIDV